MIEKHHVYTVEGHNGNQLQIIDTIDPEKPIQFWIVGNKVEFSIEKLQELRDLLSDLITVERMEY